MFSFTTFILTLLALFSLSLSAPMRRDVFVPPIVYPEAGVVWIAGQHHNVTWLVLLPSHLRLSSISYRIQGDRWCTRKHYQRDRQGISSYQHHH
jgi:hypothetical protein